MFHHRWRETSQLLPRAVQEEGNGVRACTFVMIRKRQVKIAVLFTPRSRGLDSGRQIEGDLRFGVPRSHYSGSDYESEIVPCSPST